MLLCEPCRDIGVQVHAVWATRDGEYMCDGCKNERKADGYVLCTPCAEQGVDRAGVREMNDGHRYCAEHYNERLDADISLIEQEQHYWQSLLPKDFVLHGWLEKFSVLAADKDGHTLSGDIALHSLLKDRKAVVDAAIGLLKYVEAQGQGDPRVMIPEVETLKAVLGLETKN